MLDLLRNIRDYINLPDAAKRERALDRLGVSGEDPGTDRIIELGVAWLGLAQDRSRSHDGGVARHYSLTSGWGTSYPETTGYIVPTLLDYADISGDNLARDRARRMLDWFVDIQLPDGGFQGGRIDSTPVVPVIFNTGQILLGLAAGEQAFGAYGEAMRQAADWLVNSQDPDGCWRRFPTPFAEAGEKAYETHVAWGLLEAARIESSRGYGEAALANVRWALTNQRANGWVAQCCLSDPSKPLTHTLGYFLRGLLEAYRYSGEMDLLAAARRTADGLLSGLGADGHLPGAFYSDWQPAADWVCLTGAVQVAHCWLLLYNYTNDERYRDAAFKTNCFVRRTINTNGPPEVRGAVKGSFPIDGTYGKYEYLNWAVKFCIDAQMLEQEVRRKSNEAPPQTDESV